MKIPKIQSGIISSVVVDMYGPQKDDDWAVKLIKKLEIDNPIVVEYLLLVKDKYGEHAAIVGLLMYRFIESQMEADELAELFT